MKDKNQEIPITDSRLRRKTIVAFGIFILLAAVATAGWLIIYRAKPTAEDPYIRAPFRKILQANEALFGGIFQPNNLSKTFKNDGQIKPLRLNGNIGMSTEPPNDSWRLKVARAPGDTLLISLSDLQHLPKTEIIFDFKCIEGWNQVSHWGGVKVSDFVKHYHIDSEAAQQYMGLRTADGGYFVGIDRASAMHPQTILAYEMNGQPLPLKQGAPLRLIIPVKYGIKHLKQIGVLFFSNNPPRDYWAELGYDYYSGL